MFSKNLKKLREESGISQEELGNIIGVSKSTIGMYEQGKRMPQKDTILMKIASTFGVTIDFLLGYAPTRNSELKTAELGIFETNYKEFPMLGNIACGLPVLCVEENDIYVRASSDIRADFCLTASGDSMINARIFDGDTIFIKHQNIVNNGEIAAVIVNDDEVTLKRFYYYPERQQLILQPENPMYQPQVYSGLELNHVRVIGKAVAVTHPLN